MLKPYQINSSFENPPERLDYQQPQQQSSQQSPLSGLTGMIGSMGSSTGGATAGSTSGAAGGATAGGATAGSTAGSSAGKAAMSNPWTALAAVIVANEIWSHKAGVRRSGVKNNIKDLGTTEVINQDFEKKFLPKLGIKDGSTGSKAITTFGNPISSSFHLNRTARNLKGFVKKIF